MAEMTLEERWKRDGERWRYIYLLERELAKGRIWPAVARVLVIICGIQFFIIMAMVL